MSDIATKAGAARGRRPQGPLKKASLERTALHYLERHASPVEGLRRLLARRVERAAREERCDRDEATAWVEAIVTRFAGAGLVDDRVFAEGKVASLRRRGGSARRIGLALREKGVDGETVTEALQAEDGEDRAAAEAVGIIFPNQSNRGTHVNLSGAGVVKTAPNPENAVRFIEFLTSDAAQVVLADSNNEYPVVATVKPTGPIAAYADFRPSGVNAEIFGINAARATAIYDRAGMP